jgi:hypothetical protein
MIKNYTTRVPEERTVGEIQGLLAATLAQVFLPYATTMQDGDDRLSLYDRFMLGLALDLGRAHSPVPNVSKQKSLRANNS